MLALLALGSITIGTLYQKRHVTAVDVRSANFVQIGAALLVTAPLALLESAPVVWHPDLLLALAERADLIVDFTDVPIGHHVLRNVGPDEPFGGGEPDDDFDSANSDTTGQVLQFRVVPRTGADPTTPPEFLRLPALDPLPPPTVTPGIGMESPGARGSSIRLSGSSGS